MGERPDPNRNSPKPTTHSLSSGFSWLFCGAGCPWEYCKGSEKTKCQYDKRSSEHKLKVGSQVMVYFPNQVKGKAWKFARPYFGPYKVLPMLKCNCGTALTRDQILLHWIGSACVTMRWVISYGWDTVPVQRRVARKSWTLTKSMNIQYLSPEPGPLNHELGTLICSTSVIYSL